VVFWNVAGLKGKDKSFWWELKGWDVVILMETWVDRKDWEGVVGKLPKNFRSSGRVVQWAGKKNRKCRAMGGISLGVRKELESKKEKGWERRDGIMVRRVRIGGDWWRIVEVYVIGNWGKIRGDTRVDGGEKRKSEDNSGRGF